MFYQSGYIQSSGFNRLESRHGQTSWQEKLSLKKLPNQELYLLPKNQSYLGLGQIVFLDSCHPVVPYHFLPIRSRKFEHWR